MKKPRSFIQQQMDEQEFREALDRSDSTVKRNPKLIRMMAAQIGMNVDQLEKAGKPWSEVCDIAWKRFFLTVSPDKGVAIIEQFISEHLRAQSE